MYREYSLMLFVLKWKHVFILKRTVRSVEDETRNAELNSIPNPEWLGDISQLVKIEKIEFLGISRHKVGLRL